MDTYHIAWRYSRPYVADIKSINTSGILPQIFQMALSSCCRGELNLNYTFNYLTQDDAISVIANYTIDFIMPIQKSLKSKNFLRNPFVPLGK